MGQDEAEKEINKKNSLIVEEPAAIGRHIIIPQTKSVEITIMIKFINQWHSSTESGRRSDKIT